jgi:hypothetical protein
MDCKTVEFFITNGKNNKATAYIYLFYHYCNDSILEGNTMIIPVYTINIVANFISV